MRSVCGALGEVPSFDTAFADRIVRSFSEFSGNLEGTN